MKSRDTTPVRTKGRRGGPGCAKRQPSQRKPERRRRHSASPSVGLTRGLAPPAAVEPQTPPLFPQSAPGAPLLADRLQAALRTSQTAAGREWREDHGGRTPPMVQDHQPAGEVRGQWAGVGGGAKQVRLRGTAQAGGGVVTPGDTQRGFPWPGGAP